MQQLRARRKIIALNVLKARLKVSIEALIPYIRKKNSESNLKKSEGKIDAFELWCWKRLLRVPWTVRRSNLSILKEISPEY